MAAVAEDSVNRTREKKTRMGQVYLEVTAEFLGILRAEK
jgi:hypothetical protein